MEERKARILDMVIRSHIDSAQAVPSAVIAKHLGVSSATVRSELASLEQQGYLHQPHTSAGRLPTLKGYRVYARKSIPPKRLPKAQKQYILSHLQAVRGEALWQQVASLSAQLSGYAVLVSLPTDDSLLTLEVHLSALSSTRLLAVAVLETGLIRQVMLDLDPTPTDRALREAESSLRQLALTVGDMPVALEDIASRAEDEVARTFRALAKNWSLMHPPRMFTEGLKNLLDEPESSDPGFVRAAFERLEQPTEARPSQTQEIHTSDLEHALAIVLEEAFGLVKARFSLGTNQGELLLLGPTRMRYSEALMVAQGVSETVVTTLAS
jgi:heat-inducible transcriptional repressor